MGMIPADCFMISLLATISTALECGVLPASQGFTLPVAMVYSTANDVRARVPGIATSKEGAQTFVQNLVMQTVLDALELQGRSALLPDAVISTILSHLTVRTSYEPMMCQKVVLDVMKEMVKKDEPPSCIIVGGTVTGVCTTTAAMKECKTDPQVTITAVNDAHLTITGTLSTTNLIMANWSRAMWQSVVNRALRISALRPFGPYFISATATVGGN
ncbi:hypothetical protein KIN20_005939 [Parelaphostrongylus tenuis]|uniref:Uncharacterized protein n=1 Tax=Parelaphostrongylus tenuis TaxID=148309 RepID=A0AAD5M144_PARTN|nr:hypothetical protein KIN20_005939 [Parelaphostrongylus tenuis]